MEFVPGRPPLPPPEAIIAAGHEWAVFLAPADSQMQHTPNEPYYYERKNGITTWIRPFDYIEPTDPDAALDVGRKWQHAESERRHHAARTFAKQDTAVSQQFIDGTSWRRVETKQNRVFYYNNDTKESRWDQPVQVTKVLQLMAEKEKEREAEGTEMNVDDAEWMLEQMQDEDMSDNESVDTRDSNALPQIDERIALMGKPERIAHFKSMLHDADVDPFGTWDSELNKINDWRLTAITDDAERMDLFDAVCAEIMERRNQERKEPAAKSTDPFGDLLRENVVKKTSFAKFCQRNLKDPRYLSIKTSREREKRFVKHLESVVGVNK
ncbi:hypothetical protein GGH96_002561 [Coemansia sp. RSA 1972]|nr:hypothetical protein GGH96_002561 [Coemansia sp. RSA 1972]